MTVQPTRDQLRALADAATPGPWRVEYDNEDDYEQGIAYGPFPSSLHGPESLTKWDDPRWQAEYGHHVSEVSDMRAEDAEFIAAARTAVPQLLDQLDQAEAERDRNLRNSREAKKRAIRAEARIKRLENRAASETARANEWRRKHRVMAEKRDAAHRAWFEEAKARREAEARVKAVRDVLAHHAYGGPDQEDAIRRALEGERA